MNRAPTSRFSDRVANYVKFRPNYPKEIVTILASRYGLTSESVVVDIGSGTGISTELFLKNGNPVYAVEPNEKMREAAEAALGDYTGFHSVSGTSEATTLPPEIADFIIAAQAFHWFEPVAARKELSRILKKDGRVVLIWNDRKTSGSAFAEEYEALIGEFGTDYKQVRHTNIDASRIENFFGGPFRLEVLSNEQVLDFDGLLGRLASSSYLPNETDPRFPEMKDSFRELFERHEKDGHVRIEYDTKMYVSNLGMA